ncbi:MAG: Flp pilus assembly complex ATPase component TadA [Sphingobacteriaceae bacterium]|nr:Flp pilus assembly complex ATPase component TadA [Sphingobacteriaceae bacterium]
MGEGDDIRHFLDTDLKEYLTLLDQPGVFEVQIVPYERVDGSYEGHVWYDTNQGPKQLMSEESKPLINYPAPHVGQLVLAKVWQDQIINYEVLPKDDNFYMALKRVVCYTLKQSDEEVSYLEQEDTFKLNEFASYLQKKYYWHKEPISENNITEIIENINKIYLPRVDVTFRLAILEVKSAEQLPIPQFTKFKIFHKIDKLSCEQIIGNIASASDQKAHKYDPIVEAEVPFYKHRFTGVLQPIAKFPFFVIRKHTSIVKNIEEFVFCDDPVMPEKAMHIIQRWVKENRSFLIAGAMASGKTTLLNSCLKLTNRYNPTNRIGIIEDTPEVICSSGNYYAINCASGIVNNSKLLRTSFRLTPKQIVVGEIRGAEAFEFLEAASGGCECCLGTIHASGSLQAINRFESCLKMNPLIDKINKSQIAMALNGIISIQRISIRTEVNGVWQVTTKRRITSIMRIKGYDPRFDYYEHEFLYRDPELFDFTSDGGRVDTASDFEQYQEQQPVAAAKAQTDTNVDLNNQDDFNNIAGAGESNDKDV